MCLICNQIEIYGNHGKGPVWWYPMEKMYSDECRVEGDELEQMKNELGAPKFLETYTL